MSIPPIPVDLTPREREIVRLILNGSSNLAMSLVLGCSVKTVEFHVTNIFRKTRTSSRAELLVMLMSGAKNGEAP